MNQRNHKLLFSAGIVIVIAIFSLGYHWGIHSVRSVTAAQPFRIAGDSMAPTLRDNEICQIRHFDAPIRRGDVVAVRWDQKSRVKRIAAIGGDRVDISDGRLLVNGDRLEDLIAQRKALAAPGDHLLGPATLAVNDAPEHWSRSKLDSDWIVFTHHNIHQAGRVSPIIDDYPSNQNVRRMFNPVDRLIVHIQPRLSGSRNSSKASKNSNAVSVPPHCVVVFHAEPTPLIAAVTDAVVRSRDGKAVGAASDSPIMSADLARQLVSATRPIAVRIRPEDQQAYTIRIEREIEYRGLQRKSPIKYPLSLARDEVFVVGDNVPVSVDSRTVGPIKTSDLIGIVLPKK